MAQIAPYRSLEEVASHLVVNGLEKLRAKLFLLPCEPHLLRLHLSSLFLIPQRLSSFECVNDSILGFLLTA